MRWQQKDHKKISGEVRARYSRSIILGQELANRGFKNEEQISAFLDPDHYKQSSPFVFKDMQKCVTKIFECISQGKKIAIWGDFDTDGQTSTAVLVEGLRKFGADICFHIPIRATESHGIHQGALSNFLSHHHPGLLISCDTGISDTAAIDFANQMDVDVIITDHHKLPDTLPAAYAIINPHFLEDNHPLSYLAGVGTAFQVIRAMAHEKKGHLNPSDYFDLVALGTVADIAEQRDENRFYTQMGLRQLNNDVRTAVKAILSVSGSRKKIIDETSIGFIIAPRLNAAGRLGDANPNVNFLLNKEAAECDEYARQLEQLNNERILAVENVLYSARMMISQNPDLLRNPILVLMNQKWHAGVLGIAAGKLSEKHNRPVILLREEEGIASGSARSVNGIDITSAIAGQRHLLKSFGGHAMAGGLRMSAENYPAFSNSIANAIKERFKVTLHPILEIDHYLSFSLINLDLLDEINALSPFGPGNPAPVFASRTLSVSQSRNFGNQEQHTKFQAKDSNGDMEEIICWNLQPNFSPDVLIDVAYHVTPDAYNNNSHFALEYIDSKPSSDDDSGQVDLITNQFEIIDYRHHPNAIKILQKMIADKSNPQIWYEGFEKPTEIKAICSRLEVMESETLAILTAPPDFKTLSDVISSANPSRIFFLDIPQIRLDTRGFLIRLGKMIRKILNNGSDLIRIEKIASSLNVNSAAVRYGIFWYQAHGDLIIRENDEKWIRIANGTGISNNELNALQKKLNKTLKEIQAFQDYYHRVEAPLLLRQIAQKE